jgi:hypothetical protein
VFALSAAIAGLGGVMLAGVQQTATTDDFGALQNLPVLVLAVAGGIALVSGALFGGLLFAAFGIIAQHLPAFDVLGGDGKTIVSDVLLLAPALIGISLGKNPNGAVHDISTRFRESRERMQARRAAGEAGIDPEALGIDKPFTTDDLVAIDDALGIDAEVRAVLSPAAGRSWSGAELSTWRAQTGLDRLDGTGDGRDAAVPPAAVGR